MFRKREPFDPAKVWGEFHQKFPNSSFLSEKQKEQYELRFTQEEKTTWLATHSLQPKPISDDEKKLEQELEGLSFSNEDLQKLRGIREKQKIRKLQKYWREKHLLPVNPKGNHSTDFVELVHDHKIKKSVNKKKLDMLFHALTKGNWEDHIFYDPHLPELTMSLFASGKITQQQTATLLERIQRFNDSTHVETISILDANGEFTAQAKTILIPSFYRRQYKKLNREQLNEFKLLVSNLPKSEQVFYLTKKPYRDISELTKQLVFHESMYIYAHDDTNTTFIHLSAGAQDAVGIARFGLDNYIRMKPTLGNKTISEIEEGVRKKVRYGAISYPGTKAWDNIHDFENVSDSDATEHDRYHAKLMSTLSKDMQDGLLSLVDTVRTIINLENAVDTISRY